MARAFYVPTYLETEGWQSTFYGMFHVGSELNCSNLSTVQLAGTVITSQLEVGFAILGGCVDNFKQFKHWKARRNAAGSVTRPTPWPVNPPTTTTTISGGLTRKEKRALKKSQRRLEESSSVPMDDLGIFVQTGIERSVSSNPENRNANPSDAIRSSATVVPGAPLIPANSVPRLSLNLQGSPVSAARVDSSERSGGPDHMPSISIEEEV